METSEVSEKSFDDNLIPEISDYLGEQLPPYMIPAYFVLLEKLPLNPNGKVDLKQLPEPGAAAGGGAYVAPRDTLEEELAAIWQEVLGVRNVGIDDHFFRLGGHSLKAAQLTLKVYREFHVDLQLAEFFEAPHIRGMAEIIRTGLGTRGDHVAVEAIEKRDYYGLSSVQKRMYLVNRRDSEGTGYNMPAAVMLVGDLNREKVETVFGQLIHRHESFRTSFHMVKGEPVQQVSPVVDFGIEAVTCAASQGSEAQDMREPGIVDDAVRAFIRPFDLARAPLLRAGIMVLARGGICW